VTIEAAVLVRSVPTLAASDEEVSMAKPALGVGEAARV